MDGQVSSPWCGHCKALAPKWAKAAADLKGKVKIGAVGLYLHTGLASKYGIRGYPTVKWFAAGAKSGHSDAQDYQGPREADAITQFALAELKKSGWEPDVDEIVNDDAFKNLCTENRICVLSFLPDLMESGKSGRESEIKLLKTVASKVSGASFGFGWIAAGAQPELEQAFDLRAGFPAVVVMNYEKKVASIFMQAFEESKLISFVNRMGRGRGGRRKKIRGAWPTLNTVTAWAGEDAEVIEEEFSLEDIMGDDL